jgi:hypothetical protein
MVLDFGQNLFGRSVTEALSPKRDALYGDWQWITDNGTRITKKANAINSTSVIYTVPAGKVFFLVSAFIESYIIAGTVNSVGELHINSTTNSVARLRVSGAAGTADSISVSFSIPVKLIADETLKIIASAANFSSECSITGYEVDA